MRSLILAKSGLNKIRAHQRELKQVDLEDSIKSIPPGEWCVLTHPTLSSAHVCFINPMIEEKFACVQVISNIDVKQIALFNVEALVKDVLIKAFEKRQRYKGYEAGARLFYGASDGLPGLIIDQFKNKAIVQINTAGVDKHRNLIKDTVASFIKGDAYFLDNPKYREKEYLPTFENAPVPPLEIEENGIRFSMRSEVLQKVGFYYDHRENRFQLMQLMKRLNISFERGVDLFCYAGAWGLCALKSGVAHMSFVDQGEFQTEIDTGLELNQLEGKGTYTRSDVFKFLDDAIQKNNHFDLILCDPPAFAKSLSQKDQALDGYSKLHRKVFKAARPGALIAFSSCTHYVSHEEFQKNILEAAAKENKTVQLIYSGMQGWDHPVTSLMDRSNYIKSYFYLLES